MSKALEESLNLLTTVTIDDDPGEVVGRWDGTVVGVLGMLQKQKTEH